MIENRKKWQELLRQTRAYLEVLRDGGIVFAEGRFAKSTAGIEPPAAERVESAKAGRSRPMTAEERAALKAALTDPYARLVPRPPAAAGAPLAHPAATPIKRSRETSAPGPPAKPAKVTLKDRTEGAKVIAAAEDLERLRDLISGCYMCGLSAGRTHTVPGEGNPRAALMFIGEAPGYHEDVQGRPFVGRAGELLTKMIEAMGLRREDVYIANIVKCRPPGNRDPLPEEMLACEPYLKRQIELIRPKIICALGRIAIQGLLRETTPISQLRGQWRTYQNIPLMPTFHPAYLLRNPGGKRFAWEDLKAILARLGRPVPAGRSGP